ncbi:MAG: metal-activated pyridoxal enzyme, partial [Actinobacteria bacterium]|nr:metal-activated pyridoxal enzyme [Actinomycetota bacterium]
MTTRLIDLPTPALVVDAGAFERNLATMAAVRPGATLRPHVKAHKSTSLAAHQVTHGHSTFTCATPREVVGMAEAGVGTDLLLANETIDPVRLAAMARVESATGAMVTVAVDSVETLEAARAAGLRNVLIDVNVGLPRCGIQPERAADLATRAAESHLVVRGVMGYEGHLMALKDRDEQRAKVLASMTTLIECSRAVRRAVGDDASIVSAGGTGTFDLYDPVHPILGQVNEVQAGSYALMDTHYGALSLPFEQALFVVGTVISRTRGTNDGSPSWAVVDIGLKSLGMDHGTPTVDDAAVWFCSDEHTTFSPNPGHTLPAIGERVLVRPAHVDPTVAMHAAMHVVDDV